VAQTRVNDPVFSDMRFYPHKLHEAIDFIGVFRTLGGCQNAAKEAKIRLTGMSMHHPFYCLTKPRSKLTERLWERSTFAFWRVQNLAKQAQTKVWRIVLERPIDGNNF
jgi:hypothetical protein